MRNKSFALFIQPTSNHAETIFNIKKEFDNEWKMKQQAEKLFKFLVYSANMEACKTIFNIKTIMTMSGK